MTNDRCPSLNLTEEPPAGVREGRWRAAELAATFLFFCGVASFISAPPPGTPPADVGLSDNDGHYHVKMAALLPEIGLVDKFPWLRTTIFADRFVNHHYGFQVLLCPFVYLSGAVTGDYAAGGRWFVTLMLGVVLGLFHALLLVFRVPHRWLWLLLGLLMPAQFFSRHLFVRALGVSLACMFLLCWCLFTGRHRWAGVVVCVAIHLYLGAVAYMPLLVLAVVVAELVGLMGQRWEQDAPAPLRADLRRLRCRRLVVWTFGGWIVGLLTHPYGGLDGLRFLYVQIFGSGLSPDLPVGQEWESYSSAWFFANMSGITLSVAAVAITLRLRFGPRLDVNELALLLMNFAFFVLVLKARRFIEYWPVFSLLSSAVLAGPVLRARRPRPMPAEASFRQVLLTVTTMILCTAGTGVVAAKTAAAYVPAAFSAEWRLWSLLTGVLALVPLVRPVCGGLAASSPRRRVLLAGGAGLLSGAVICGSAALLIRYLGAGNDSLDPRFPVGWLPFVILAVSYALIPAFSAHFGSAGPSTLRAHRFLSLSTRLCFAVIVLAAVSIPAGASLGWLRNDHRSRFDLPTLRELMFVLEAESNPGDVVFTDDWDVFPVYFYLNHRNHYVTGLDPKFSQARDPVLWERFVQITRGHAPVKCKVDIAEGGALVTREIQVKLTDIRDEFRARFVIVDKDHLALSRKLDAAPEFARRIFPRERSKGEAPPYCLYQILPIGVPEPRDTPVEVEKPPAARGR